MSTTSIQQRPRTNSTPAATWVAARLGGWVQRLLDRHPQLRVTLFVTPDWHLTRPGDAAVARRLGLLARPGYLMALASQTRHEPAVGGWANDVLARPVGGSVVARRP